MEKHKTNENVKAGLQPERKKNDNAQEPEKVKLPPGKEIDADDKIHEPDFEPTAEFNKVHSEVDNNKEQDPDDLVHER